MVILTTLVLTNILFGGGSNLGFLDPRALRDAIEGELADSDTRDSALALVDELERLARQYDESFIASVEAYKTELSNTETTAEDLIANLEPWDRERRLTLQEIVRIRQSMLDVLSESEWDEVFG
jgi:hypothetical protein